MVGPSKESMNYVWKLRITDGFTSLPNAEKRIPSCQVISRHVRQVKSGGGGSFARNVDQVRHEFQLYDVTDTLRRWLDYNVGLFGLCFEFFFEFWDLIKLARRSMCWVCIAYYVWPLYSEVHVLAYSIFAIMQRRVSASSVILHCMHAFGKCGPCSPAGGGGGGGRRKEGGTGLIRYRNCLIWCIT